MTHNALKMIRVFHDLSQKVLAGRFGQISIRYIFTSTFGNGLMLHEALKMIRVFHDLPQKVLAERFGIAPSFLSEIESGKKQPTLPLLQKYSQEFKIPVSSIMYFSESLKDGSIGERTRISVSRKVLAILTFIAERSGRVDA
jgi:transcriptional regulator with XRE-family HTH domain